MNLMKINLKCFADLAKEYDCDYREPTALEVTESANVDDVLRARGVNQDRVKIVFVNGRSVDATRSLSDGDRVALVPATGGM